MVSPAVLLERAGIDEFEIDEKTRTVKIPERCRQAFLKVLPETYPENIIGVEAFGWRWYFVPTVWELFLAKEGVS
ncbi:MAG: hypothetical protein QXS27_03780 [Candidatus Jordarchaeaceae archaeon]